MQTPFKDSRRKGIALKPVALAVALALPNVASLAASMKDVVSTRVAQSIGEQYGRDSLYAFSPDAQRFKSGQNPTNSGWLSRSVKSRTAGTSGKAASLAMPDSAHSVDLFPANRPQPYGRAGGYIGWERVVMMQLFPTTVATSAFQDRHIVKNGPGHGGNVADLPAGDHIYRRKSAAWSGEEVNADIPVTNEGEGQSAAGTNAIPEPNKQPGSASAAPPEPTSLRFDDQLAALVQPADDMSALEHPSGGQDDPNTDVQREPDPFTTEDHSSATVRGESADMSAPENGSGDQSDQVVRALPEQAPLRPDDEGYLNAEDHHFDPVPVKTSRDTSVTDNASLDEADPTTAIVVPLTTPSDGERDSLAVARLREEPAPGASGGQDMPEVEVTVSVVGEESPMEAIRMSKRVK